MPEMYPSKLTVPYASNQNYEFTLHREVTIAQFKENVLQSCPDEIKDFELIPPSAEGSEDTSNMSIGELKTKKFKMRVNKKTGKKARKSLLSNCPPQLEERQAWRRRGWRSCLEALDQPRSTLCVLGA